MKTVPSLTIVAAVLSIGAEGRYTAPSQASATPAVGFTGNISFPKPTIPSKPNIFHGGLFRRAPQGSGITMMAPDSICGYTSDTKYYACPSGSKCGLVQAFSTFTGFVICDSRGHANYGFTSCVAHGGKCDSKCQSDMQIMSCTGTQSPYCNTFALPGNVTDYLCQSSKVPRVVPVQTTQDNDAASPRTYSPFPDYRSSSPPTGAIVGGIIGGIIAVIAIIIAVTCFIIRSRKRKATGGPSNQVYTSIQSSPSHLMTQPIHDVNSGGCALSQPQRCPPSQQYLQTTPPAGDFNSHQSLNTPSPKTPHTTEYHMTHMNTSTRLTGNISDPYGTGPVNHQQQQQHNEAFFSEGNQNQSAMHNRVCELSNDTRNTHRSQAYELR